MALNIEDTETEKLAAEVAEMTGDTKTGAVREALREKMRRWEEDLVDPEQSGDFYKTDIVPALPPDFDSSD